MQAQRSHVTMYARGSAMIMVRQTLYALCLYFVYLKSLKSCSPETRSPKAVNALRTLDPCQSLLTA